MYGTRPAADVDIAVSTYVLFVSSFVSVGTLVVRIDCAPRSTVPLAPVYGTRPATAVSTYVLFVKSLESTGVAVVRIVWLFKSTVPLAPEYGT